MARPCPCFSAPLPWFSAPLPWFSAPLRAALCGLGLVTSACTQPTFPGQDSGADASATAPDERDASADAATPRRDAELADVDASDSDDAEIAALPASAASLRGFFARRSTFFNVDMLNEGLAQGLELALLEFADDGRGGIALHTQLCDVSVVNELLIAITIPNADALSALTQPVLFEPDGSFHVARSSVFHGYDPQRADALACAGAGDRKPRQDDQTWACPADYLDAPLWNEQRTCACPGIAGDPPTTPTDCRLVDDDGDDQPALSAVASPVPFLGEVAWNITLEVSIGFERGSITPEREILARETRGLRVSCVGSQAFCDPAQTNACKLETSQVVFAPLPAAISCAELRAQATRLFPQSPPGFPSVDTCLGR